MSAFVSELSNITLHDSGWEKLATGVEISKLSAWDSEAQLFARRGWKGAQEWAESKGWRLPTVEEYRELRSVALHIDPYTMPNYDMLKRAGIELSDTRSIDAFRNSHMRSEAWCRQHDEAVFERLHALDWENDPVFNDGKHWSAGGYIFGWVLKSGNYIQGPSLAHKDHEHTDYATTFHVVREPVSGAVDGENGGTYEVEAVVEIDTSPPAEAPPDSEDRRTLKLTNPFMQGWDVRDLQEAIGAAVDGVFGPNTHGLVVNWQRKRGLVADGIVGAKTWAAIDAESYPYEEEPVSSTDPSPAPAGVVNLLPEISFRQARHFRKGRRGPAIWVVIHTAETIEHEGSAESLQAYAATMKDNRVASWHFSVDSNSICQSVDIKDTAFAAPGANTQGVQIELAGRARQSAADWDDAFSRAQLELCAKLCASLCTELSIPVQKVGPTEMRGGMPGLCGHVDVTKGVGKGRTNHYDPGPNFPWDTFLDKVRSFM